MSECGGMWWVKLSNRIWLCRHFSHFLENGVENFLAATAQERLWARHHKNAFQASQSVLISIRWHKTVRGIKESCLSASRKRSRLHQQKDSQKHESRKFEKMFHMSGGIKLKEKVKMEMEVREKEGKTTSFMVSVLRKARERVGHADSTTDRSLASPLHAPRP